jgi:hypothetical protein
MHVWENYIFFYGPKKSNPEKPKVFRGFCGAGEQIRTAYLFITNLPWTLRFYRDLSQFDAVFLADCLVFSKSFP